MRPGMRVCCILYGRRLLRRRSKEAAMSEFHHISVLHDECIDALRIRPDGVYVDATLGGGGHAYSVAERLTQGGRLYGIDRDADALAAFGIEG